MTEDRPGCLWAILRLFGWRPKQPAPGQPPASEIPIQTLFPLAAPEEATPAPYYVRQFLLSKSERTFYQVLRKAAGDRVVVCPQVRLADIFDTPRREAFGKIAYRHVDFLLCQPGTFRPLAGIELDDAGHRRPERIKHDEFKEQVFKAANLPLIRVPVQTSYAIQPLEKTISEILTANPPRRIDPLPAQDPLAPLCPKCGEVMVVRVAQTGSRKGRPFYGCSKYPTCKGTLPYETA